MKTRNQHPCGGSFQRLTRLAMRALSLAALLAAAAPEAAAVDAAAKSISGETHLHFIEESTLQDQQGDMFTVNVEIAGLAGLPAGSHVWFGLYLSKDQVINTCYDTAVSFGYFYDDEVKNGTYRGTFFVGGVEAHRVAPGTYYWGLEVNPLAGEANLANNSVAGNAVVVDHFANYPPFEYGRSLEGEVFAQGDKDAVHFEAAPGTTLTVKAAQLAKGLTLQVDVYSAEGAGTFHKSVLLKKQGKRAKLKLNVPDDMELVLRVRAMGGATGSYRLETKAKVKNGSTKQTFPSLDEEPAQLIE